jgi:hypothetical protein
MLGAVLLLVEAEDGFRSADEDGPPDQVGLRHHHVDRFFLRPRQRAILEDRTPRADEVEELRFVDVLFEELARRRMPVDVALLDLDALRVQKPSGVAAGRSGWFPEEGGLRHFRRLP